MARMRSLKPEFWLDRKLARLLSRDERMLYMGLWNQADEFGRANGDPRVIKGQVFPFDDDLTDAVIGTMLKALESAGVVVLYEHGGDPFLHLPKLAKHQRLEPHKVPTRVPDPPPVAENQQTIPLDMAPDQPVHAPPGPGPDGARIGPGRDPGGAHAKHVAGGMEHSSRPVSDPDKTAPTFEDFYSAYPRREARRKAEQAWASALKRTDAETIMAGLKRFQFRSEPQFVPQPASWLNADRWADEAPAAAAKSRTVPPWEDFR